MHRRPAHSSVLDLHLSRVDANSDLGRVAMQAAMRRQPALNRDSTVDRIARDVKHDEKAVAGMVYLAPVMLCEGAPQLAIEPRAEVVPRSVPDRLDQRCRTCEIGE